MQVSDVSGHGSHGSRVTRIRFAEAFGPNVSPSSPAVVLLHDAMANHETFASTMSALAPSFRVIAPDFPGFGASEKPDPRRYRYGCESFADSIADMIAALDLGRVHVCGHAMGGGVALALAARHPALVNKLVLVDALVYPTYDLALDRVGRVPILGAVVWQQAVGPALFRAYVQASVYAGAATVSRARIDALFASFNAPAARRAAHATMVAKTDTRSIIARLPRITAESLIVWGRHDALAPVEHGRRLARALGARLDVLECGRCPPDERPGEFAAAVAAFLRSVPATRGARNRPSGRALPHLP
jgi:pimeloyl-ACP methyl ester carboxylesterase